MHELAIAQSLLDAARRHVPAGGAVLRAVRVRVGPLQCVDPVALDFAWRSIFDANEGPAPRLEVITLPWCMRCPRCGNEWLTQALDHRCTCGCDIAYPVNGNQLELESLEVDEPPSTSSSDGAPQCESLSSKTY
jgi:Zn finger protein HypA/HybF involved in hydrogenase expression